MAASSADASLDGSPDGSGALIVAGASESAPRGHCEARNEARETAGVGRGGRRGDVARSEIERGALGVHARACGP